MKKSYYAIFFVLGAHADQQLIKASADGAQLEVRRLLGFSGIDVNYRDVRTGNTAAMATLEHYLVIPAGKEREHLEAVFYLLAHSDADLTIENNRGKSPLKLIKENPLKLWGFRKYLKK